LTLFIYLHTFMAAPAIGEGTCFATMSTNPPIFPKNRPSTRRSSGFGSKCN